MGKFCKYCGGPLSPNANFCTACGAKVQAVGPPAEHTGNPASTAFDVRAVQTPAPPGPATDAAVPTKQAICTAAELLGKTISAPASAGEMRFYNNVPENGHLPAAIGPFKCVAQEFFRTVKGLKALPRDKRRWIPAAVLAFIWLVLMLLSALGWNPPPVRGLSFLTFAGGGTTGGLAELVGGLVGKGVFAYFITTLVMPLTRRQKPFTGIGSGFAQWVFVLNTKGQGPFSALLTGMGAALITYNFMAGSATPSNSMVAITAFLLSLRALSSKDGFLRRFIGSLTAALQKSRHIDTALVARLMAGFTAGFALALPLSLIPLDAIGHIAGILALVAAIVLKMISANQRGVTL